MFDRKSPNEPSAPHETLVADCLSQATTNVTSAFQSAVQILNQQGKEFTCEDATVVCQMIMDENERLMALMQESV